MDNNRKWNWYTWNQQFCAAKFEILFNLPEVGTKLKQVEFVALKSTLPVKFIRGSN
jgi:hypothetical protein